MGGNECNHCVADVVDDEEDDDDEKENEEGCDDEDDDVASIGGVMCAKRCIKQRMACMEVMPPCNLIGLH